METFAPDKIHVKLRFYGDLNDLISGSNDKLIVERTLPEPVSIKDLIEGCGVPHTEVDMILINGRPAGFSHRIEGDENVSVYPFFSSIEIPETDRLQRGSLETPRFIVDVNLGKLARYLRLAGFDAAYRNDAKDDELIEQMLEEDLALLTRDRKLLMRKVVKTGYLPRSTNAADQFEEVLERFDLFDDVDPYSRCITCNGILERVEKEKVIDQLEPLTKQHYERFSQCVECDQVYWAGSHRNRLEPKMKKILNLKE